MRININNAPRRYSVIYADPPWAYKQQGGAALKAFGANL